MSQEACTSAESGISPERLAQLKARLSVASNHMKTVHIVPEEDVKAIETVACLLAKSIRATFNGKADPNDPYKTDFKHSYIEAEPLPEYHCVNVYMVDKHTPHLRTDLFMALHLGQDEQGHIVHLRATDDEFRGQLAKKFPAKEGNPKEHVPLHASEEAKMRVLLRQMKKDALTHLDMVA